MTLKDAVLTFTDKQNVGNDRIFQIVKGKYNQAQHKAVLDAYNALVASANASHHDILREISVAHPVEVFQNNMQRMAFEALCELIKLDEQQDA